MKIENKEQTILGLHANFEHDPSMYVLTGAKKRRARDHVTEKIYNKLGLSFAKL